MASMRDIKRRKDSIQSTGQITKAMKLVATVKLQKAKSRAEESKPYFNYMYDTVTSMLEKSGNISHPYLQAGESTKKGFIVIKGDFKKEDCVIYAVGRKGRETLERLGYEIKADYSEVINEPLYKDAQEIGRAVLDAFTNNELGEIYLVYTVFKNTVSQIPTCIKLLPISKEDLEKDNESNGSDKKSMDDLTLMNYEPEAEEALNTIIPKYINSLIYGALVESVASENGARMQAMDSATNNAEDMISDLSLKYNRARQGAITQELTEIIAGASAIE